MRTIQKALFYFCHYSVLSCPVSYRLLSLVWWTTLTTRTKRKKMRRRTSHHENDLVWALKTSFPLLFGHSGQMSSPSRPPSSGRLIGPRPAGATFQSHREDRRRRAPAFFSPELSFAVSESGDGEFLWKDASVCSWRLVIFLKHFFYT